MPVTFMIQVEVSLWRVLTENFLENVHEGEESDNRQ